MSQSQYIELIPINGFDINKVIIGMPESAPIKDNTGKETGSYMRSSLTYKHKGGEGPILLELPKVFSFGINESYTFGKERAPENISGYKVTYFLANPSKENKDLAQTPEQKTTTHTLNLLKKKADDHFAENADCFGESKEMIAKNKMLVKPINNRPLKKTGQIHPKSKKEIKEPDMSKPEQFDLKCAINTKTKKFITKFYGVKNKAEGRGKEEYEMDPMTEVYGKVGDILPVAKIDYIYIGEKATFQLSLYEANFYPRQPLIHKRVAPVSYDKNDEQEMEEQDDKVNGTSDPNNDLDSSPKKNDIVPKKVAIKPPPQELEDTQDISKEEVKIVKKLGGAKRIAKKAPIKVETSDDVNLDD